MKSPVVGIKFTRTDLDYAVGNVAFVLHQQFDRAVTLNTKILTLSDQDWLELGYTVVEKDLIKAALADLAYMKATAFDSSQNVKALWGLGI